MAEDGPGYREGTYSADDGLALYYRDYGDPLWSATPVLCLGGLTRNAADFDDLAAHLAALQRRVITPDYRGRGRSAYDPDWRNYRAEVHVGDIEALLTSLNVHRVIIVGTSLGGLLAMGLAVVRATALAGVVLNDVGPEIDSEGLDRIADYVGTPVTPASWDEAARQLMHLYSPVYPDLDEDGWMDMARSTYRENESGELHLVYDLNLGKAMAAAGPPDEMWAYFKALEKIPTLAIRGAISDILSVDVFDRMAEIKPDLRRVTVKNRGHVPLLDEPECLEAIDDFIANL